MTPGKRNSLHIETRKGKGARKRRVLLHRSNKTFRTYNSIKVRPGTC